MKKILFLLSLFSFLFIGSFFYQKRVAAATLDDIMVACTADVKMCSDGSYVSRVAPDCSFAPCPDECQYDSAGDPICPFWNQRPLDCEGGVQVAGDINSCGCQMPPKCEYPDGTPSPKVNCQTNGDCLPGQTCYQPPMPVCPEGMACIQVMPQKYCVGETTLPENCPVYDGKVMCPQWDPAPGFCEGGTLIPSPDNECGCSMPPSCEYPESSPSPSPEIIYCDSSSSSGNSFTDPSVCPIGYVCASVPPGGCGTGPNGEPLACATQPYCRLAEGSSCQTSENCYSGYLCQDGSCHKQSIADINNDGKVNINDYTILSSQLMMTGNNSADLNGDGIVNLMDFTIMMSEFQVI